MTRDQMTVALIEQRLIHVDAQAGVVRRVRGPGGHILTSPQVVPGSNVNGYRAATFKLNGIRKQLRLHRVVWIAANGVPAEGLVVCHLNNIKTDNRIGNLYLATPTANIQDAARDGLLLSGDASPNTKLPERMREEVVSEYRRDELTLAQIASRFGISKSRVWQIVRGSGFRRNRCGATA